MSTGHIVISIVFVLLYLSFLFWYGGRSKPLSPAEVENLLAEMKHRAAKQAQTEESPILDQFCELTKNDDGREYYMVNLLKFRKKALYPEGSTFGDDPLAATAVTTGPSFRCYSNMAVTRFLQARYRSDLIARFCTLR